MFDEALSVIAASRVMLGQLFWRSRDDAVALKELEPSCPILWEYDVAKTSLDSDVSIDNTSYLPMSKRHLHQFQAENLPIYHTFL